MLGPRLGHLAWSGMVHSAGGREFLDLRHEAPPEITVIIQNLVRITIGSPDPHSEVL
jgi:hypothetical protein